MNTAILVVAIIGCIWGGIGAPSDPYFDYQYHLQNVGGTIGDLTNCVAGYDVNVTGVWNAGNRGSGVQIAVVDNGLFHTVPDVSPNYKAVGSYNFVAKTSDPTPSSSSCTHGTSCSGLAAAASNSYCGVGAAYEADLAGINLLCGSATNIDASNALTYYKDQNDIYSNSWGPQDTTLEFDAIDSYILSALKMGTSTGRSGKGNVYVWAAGNGGSVSEWCGWDGYATQPYSMAISSIGCTGELSSYSEHCSNLFAVTPGEATTTTTISGSYCRNAFSGTSASCPIAAGVVALLLAQNSTLGYRDIQHIIVHSSRQIDATDSTWKSNAGGVKHSTKYGFGLIDAYAATALAFNWTGVGTLYQYDSSLMTSNLLIPHDGTFDDVEVDVLYHLKVEHVQVEVHSDVCHSGALLLVLISPSGTESILQPIHVLRESLTYIRGVDYRFMTVQFWDEDAFGVWKLRVMQDKNDNQPQKTLKAWQLTIRGTQVGSYPTPPSTIPAPYSGTNDYSICAGSHVRPLRSLLLLVLTMFIM